MLLQYKQKRQNMPERNMQSTVRSSTKKHLKVKYLLALKRNC